ncbi:MAG TPA: hypothetical protein VF178_02870, partial [Gemmatimonadaceae bacterium]
MASNQIPAGVTRRVPPVLCAAALLALAAWTSAAPPPSGSNIIESWRDPDAQPLNFKGEKVVAVVMLQDPKARRRAEDAL